MKRQAERAAKMDQIKNKRKNLFKPLTEEEMERHRKKKEAEKAEKAQAQRQMKMSTGMDAIQEEEEEKWGTGHIDLTTQGMSIRPDLEDMPGYPQEDDDFSRPVLNEDLPPPMTETFDGEAEYGVTDYVPEEAKVGERQQESTFEIKQVDTNEQSVMKQESNYYVKYNTATFEDQQHQ